MIIINMTAVWVGGIIVLAIALGAIYAAHKGWLK